MFGVTMASIGMVCIFGYLSAKVKNDEIVDAPFKLFDIAQVFGNIGVAMFVFEGNAVVINVRAETKN